jgi:predicted nucleotidyltransferase
MARQVELSMFDRDALAHLITASARVFAARRILAAYAFGSRVSGRPRPASDLDVGYYLEGYQRGETLSIAEEMQLATELSRAADLDIDLCNLADASLEFRGRVLEEGIRIFEGDPVARVALERELLGRYHDYKPVFQRLHERRLRAVAERGL